MVLPGVTMHEEDPCAGCEDWDIWLHNLRYIYGKYARTNDFLKLLMVQYDLWESIRKSYNIKGIQENKYLCGPADEKSPEPLVQQMVWHPSAW